jgi:hypothetical protein
MRAITKSQYVPVSLGTNRTEQGGFSYDTQGHVRDKLGTIRDKRQGTRIYGYAVPLSRPFRSAPATGTGGVSGDIRPSGRKFLAGGGGGGGSGAWLNV